MAIFQRSSRGTFIRNARGTRNDPAAETTPFPALPIDSIYSPIKIGMTLTVHHDFVWEYDGASPVFTAHRLASRTCDTFFTNEGLIWLSKVVVDAENPISLGPAGVDPSGFTSFDSEDTWASHSGFSWANGLGADQDAKANSFEPGATYGSSPWAAPGTAVVDYTAADPAVAHCYLPNYSSSDETEDASLVWVGGTTGWTSASASSTYLNRWFGGSKSIDTDLPTVWGIIGGESGWTGATKLVGAASHSAFDKDAYPAGFDPAADKGFSGFRFELTLRLYVADSIALTNAGARDWLERVVVDSAAPTSLKVGNNTGTSPTIDPDDDTTSHPGWTEWTEGRHSATDAAYSDVSIYSGADIGAELSGILTIGDPQTWSLHFITPSSGTSTDDIELIQEVEETTSPGGGGGPSTDDVSWSWVLQWWDEAVHSAYTEPTEPDTSLSV